MASDNDITVAQALGQLQGELRTWRDEDKRRWDDFQKGDEARWKRLDEIIVSRGVRLRRVERYQFAQWFGIGGALAAIGVWLQQHFFKG
jgi:hypothetical protein